MVTGHAQKMNAHHSALHGETPISKPSTGNYSITKDTANICWHQEKSVQ